MGRFVLKNVVPSSSTIRILCLKVHSLKPKVFVSITVKIGITLLPDDNTNDGSSGFVVSVGLSGHNYAGQSISVSTSEGHYVLPFKTGFILALFFGRFKISVHAPLANIHEFPVES